jgi:beta-lactamase regulating signal transducer with metallopeptidase domain
MMLALVPWGTLDLRWLPVSWASQPVSTQAGNTFAQESRNGSEVEVASASTTSEVSGDTPANVGAMHGSTASQASALPAANESTSLASSDGATLRALFTWNTGLLVVWLIVLAGLAILVARRILAARRWRREWRLITESQLLTMTERLSLEFGLFQPPVLFASERCTSPMVFGAVRTVIVLPAGLVERSTAQEMQMILSHEIAHIRRGDLVGNWFSSVVAAVFFFHPGVWLALRESRLAQEVACDELAVGRPEVSAADYGRLLVELATRCPLRATPLLSVGMVESFQLFLKRRLSAMKNMRSRSKAIVACSWAVVAVAMLGLLPWRLVAQTGSGSGTFTVATGSSSGSADSENSKERGDRGKERGSNVTGTAGNYSLKVDRVRRVSSPSHDQFPNGFPLFAGMKLNEQSNVQQDVSGSSGGGAISGGVGGSYSYHRPNLILDVELTAAKRGKKQLLCNVIGEVKAKDDQGREVMGSQAGPWLKLLVDGVDYQHGAGRTAIHLALPASSSDAVCLESVDGELLVAEGTLDRIEFKDRDLRKRTMKKGEHATARLDKIEQSSNGIEVTLAVSAPDQGPQTPKLEQLRQGKNMMDLMKQEMIRNSPGRVTLVMEDSEGRSHYGKSEEFGKGGDSSSAGSSSWSSSGQSSNGVKWSRGGSSSTAQADEAGLVPAKYHFRSLPEGVEVKSIACVVMTCESEPKKVPFHLDDVALPE